MTVSEIIQLNNAFASLNGVSGKLSAKAKWNLAMNLKRCAEVAKTFEEQRVAVFKKFASEGANELKVTDEGFPGYKKEIEEMLAVESDTKLLRFDFSDIVKDDLEVPSDVIAALEPILDGIPA